jgi:hypothetical protein
MNRKKIIDILTQFQEGIIEELKLSEGDLNVKIECSHLAGLLRPGYSHFYVVLKGTRDVYFHPWDEEDIIVTSIRDIQLFKPDILNVEYYEQDFIKIYSNCEHVYSGGNLYLWAEDIKVYDEELNPVYLEQLAELSDRYWYSSDSTPI